MLHVCICRVGERQTSFSDSRLDFPHRSQEISLQLCTLDCAGKQRDEYKTSVRPSIRVGECSHFAGIFLPYCVLPTGSSSNECHIPLPHFYFFLFYKSLHIDAMYCPPPTQVFIYIRIYLYKQTYIVRSDSFSYTTCFRKESF